jgi:hypothetical protein
MTLRILCVTGSDEVASCARAVPAGRWLSHSILIPSHQEARCGDQQYSARENPHEVKQPRPGRIVGGERAKCSDYGYRSKQPYDLPDKYSDEVHKLFIRVALLSCFRLEPIF